MMNREQEIQYLQGMIVELNKAINNAQQFGDEVTVQCINNQIAMYQKRLAELEEQEAEVEEAEEQEVEEAEAEAEEVQYLKEMIVELNKGINNAQQFGDEVTVNAINNQILMYQKRLAQLSNN